MAKLTPQLKSALRECGDHGRGPFWWRQASMKKLADMGLVVAWHPRGRTDVKLMAYRITDAGRAALQEASNGK